jgi:hypothetical protein
VGLLGAIGLILVLESVVSPSIGKTNPRARIPLSVGSAGRAAAGPEGRAEILCFGDSLIKLGILPRVLERRLGASAYNLAVLGGQAPQSYFLLRRVLRQGHHPRAILVNFSAILLAMDPRFNAEGWSMLAEGRDGLELAWRTGDPAATASLSLPALIASWRLRDGVRANLGLGRRDTPEDGSRGDDLAVFQRNWRLNRGAQVAPRLFVPIRGAAPVPLDGRRWRWKPQPVHAFYVEQFLSLAQSHRVPVYWVLTPALSDWRAQNERAGTAHAYRQFIRGYLPRFPGLTVLDGQHVNWDRRAFRDPIHLNRDGAVTFSLAVAEAVAMRSGATGVDRRWAELKGDHTGPPGRFPVLVEDLDESRSAVNRRAGVGIVMEGSRW